MQKVKVLKLFATFPVGFIAYSMAYAASESMTVQSRGLQTTIFRAVECIATTTYVS